MNIANIKNDLAQLCLDKVEKNIEVAKMSKARATEAMYNETKSSAGDKYETGREMAQGEIDKAEMQLSKANYLNI